MVQNYCFVTFLLEEFRLKSAVIAKTMKITRSTLKKIIAVIPPIESNPPNIVANTAAMTPKIAPKIPMMTPNRPAPSPIIKPPIGIATSKIKGSMIMISRALIKLYTD